MSLKEILSKVFAEAESEVTNQFFWSEASDEYLEDESHEFFQYLQDQGIKFKFEAGYGGEGKGEDYWSVYSFTKDDEKVYIKFDGWYLSYNGSEFTEWFFVEPKQKTITVFVKE